MLPRWHILLGAILTAILWYFLPQLGWINLGLVFLSSFLIDFDHYMQAVLKTGKIGLFSAFDYHKKQATIIKNEHLMGIRKKGDFHVFHTVEFHALVGILGIFYSPLFFIFAGMLFHSLIDVVSLLDNGYMYRREYFFVNWMGKNLF